MTETINGRIKPMLSKKGTMWSMCCSCLKNLKIINKYNNATAIMPKNPNSSARTEKIKDRKSVV